MQRHDHNRFHMLSMHREPQAYHMKISPWQKQKYKKTPACTQRAERNNVLTMHAQGLKYTDFMLLLLLATNWGLNTAWHVLNLSYSV